MSTLRSKEAAEHDGPRRREEPRSGRERSTTDQKWRYLRTVYVLNPGIPHYLDFPHAGE